MKKILFILCFAILFIACEAEKPDVNTTRPDIDFPTGSADDIKSALNGMYNKSDWTAWSGGNSSLIDEASTLHNKVLLSVVGGTTPNASSTFIALFISDDNNVGFAIGDDPTTVVNAAKSKEGSLLTSWDPRKLVYKDSGRVKISWLGRVATPQAGGAFNPGISFDDGKLGVSKDIGNISSLAKWAIIPFANGAGGVGNSFMRPGQYASTGSGSISTFVYEGRLGDTADPNAGNPNGGISPQRRAWAWIGSGTLEGTKYDERYAYIVIPSQGTLFGYAPKNDSGEDGQSDVAFPYTGGTESINLSVSSTDKSINNSAPLGKQIIFRQDKPNGHNIGSSQSRLIMLTTVVAEAVHLHNNGVQVGDKKEDVVLIEFPAFSALDAIYDGYTTASAFPGYTVNDLLSTPVEELVISSDFGKDKVDGATLLTGETYDTIKIPFLLLSGN